MMLSVRHMTAFLAVIAGQAIAVDGIAVSTQIRGVWNTSGDIMRYDIRSSAVVNVTKIFDGAGGFTDKSRVGARFPAFNKEGTKIAFYRATTDSGWFVCEMNPDGSAVRNLARIPQEDGYDGRGYLYWPVGAWVYYILSGENHREGNHRLWRVNTQTLHSEEVVAFQYGLWQWGMSSDATRMHLRVWEDNGTDWSTFAYTLPGDGSIPAGSRIGNGAGCGANLSPSGNQLSYLQGGGHTYLATVTWANLTKENGDYGFSSEQINGFVLPGSQQVTQCTWADGREVPLTAGYGMDCNRWSTNSDKWMCLQMGWIEQPGGSGRYSFCGSNQVLFNWVDSVAINASQSVRACGEGGGFESGCDISLPYSEYRKNGAGDFLVTGPLEDINEDLREFVTGVGSRVAPMKHRGRINFVVVPGRLIVQDLAGSWNVQLFDARGSTVAHARTNAQRQATIRTDLFPRGMYVVRVKSESTVWAARILLGG